MDKKWSCPACEYKSGRRSNVERHIERKHGNYVLPVLSELLPRDPHHQTSQYYTDRYFPQQPPEALVQRTKEKKDEAFISSYKFQDKRLGIYKIFLDATKLPPSEYRTAIVDDLMLQMKRASSNPFQFWPEPLNLKTSTMNTYSSPSNSVPTWRKEIAKLPGSEILNNSESSIKCDSAAKTGVSSDNHEEKLQVILKILDWKKEREIYEHLIREIRAKKKLAKVSKLTRKI